MNCRLNPPASSLLATFWLSSWLEQYAQVSKDMSDFSAAGLYNTWGQPRISWKCATPFNSSSSPSIRFMCPMASGSVALVDNMFDFTHSLSPVAIIDDSGVALFAGLDFVTTSTTPGSDFMVTVTPISEDVDIFWMEPGGYAWERIPCMSPTVYAASGMFQLPMSSTVLVTYSASLLAASLDVSGFVSFNNGPWIPLSPHDLWNRWDETGSLYGLSRLQRENNYDFFTRQSSSYGFPGAPYPSGLMATIARELNLIELSSWVPDSPYVPPYGDVTAYSIPLIPQYSLITETPLAIGNNTYLLSNTPDANTVYILNDNMQPYISAAVTGNMVQPLFGSNGITVSYGVTRYEPQLSASGYVIQIVPSTGAIISMSETPVWLARGISLNTLGSPDMIDSLYYPNGDPTPYFQTIGEQVQQTVKISLGEASWNNVTWFDSTTELPQISYIPRVLDS